MSVNIPNFGDLIDTLGWTLFHSIWQIALIALVLFVVLRSLPQAAANVRYALSVAAIFLSFAAPVVTLIQVSSQLSSAALPRHTEKEFGREEPPLVGNSSSAVPTPRAMNADVDDTDKGNQLLSLSSVIEFSRQTLPTSFPFAIAVWLVGIALFSFRLCGGLWKLREYRHNGTTPADSYWQDRLVQLCDSLKVSRAVTLIRSDLLTTPVAVGVIKPMIIIPTGVFLQMNPQQLETIIAHELVHIRRYDCLINAFQSIAEILFFYHPAMWWISNEIRREREFSADEAVLKVASDGVTYATALADLEELRHAAKMTVPSSAMAANGGNLMQRISRILNKKTEISRAGSAWSAGLAFAVISILLLALFSFSSRSVVNGQKRDSGNRKLAIGFVGIPPLDRSNDPPKDADATARILIAKLQQYKVPAIGFLTGSQISDGEKLFPVRANIVRLWRDAGLEVGIGGYKHLPFGDQPLDVYIANVEKNERIAKQLLSEKNQTLRYFSYPYLYTRKNDEHQKFENWLKDQGLTSVKYTIDNNEWMYSFAYDMARNDNDVNTMKEVRAAFLDYMTRMFDHYEAYSKEMFGREIPETMVLTPSRLVADSADDLFGMVKSRGYKFVSMDEAMADEAFSTPENYSGDNGISWFERWTLTAGKRLRDEPKIDPNVQKIWDQRKPSSK